MSFHNRKSKGKGGNSKKKHNNNRPINGNQNDQSNGKSHGAIICRIFPQARDLNAPPAKVQFLLQKRAADGLYEFLSVPSREASSSSAAKHALRLKFSKQCGHTAPTVSNQPESPPLIHGAAVEVGGVSYWVYLLPTVFNNWIPNPSHPVNNAINYTNEVLKLAKGTYNTVQGHVWVDADDLASSCVPNGPIAPTECQLINSQLNEIAKIILSTAKKQYQRQLLCGSADCATAPVLLFPETAIQIKFQADYKNSTFKLILANMKSENVDFILKPVQCPSPNVLSIVNTSFPPDTAQRVRNNGHITLAGAFKISDYFSYADLPVFEFLYQTPHSFHRIRFRMPLFVFRCGESLPFHTSTNAAELQTELQTAWNLLPQEFTLQVKMGKLDDAAKLKWLEDLKKCGLPVCIPLAGGIIPIVMKLGDAGCLFLLNITDPTPDTSVLNINCKYSERKTFESMLEVIYGLSSDTAGMEISLLDAPAYT